MLAFRKSHFLHELLFVVARSELLTSVTAHFSNLLRVFYFSHDQKNLLSTSFYDFFPPSHLSLSLDLA